MLFDIFLLPINIIQKQEQPEFSGLLVSLPPKRPARGRNDDTLILFVSMPGEDIQLTIDFSPILSELADTFYRTSGSVTSAFQAVINQFNEILLKENLRDKMGGQILATLNLGAVRRNMFYLAQAGSTHAYLVDKEAIKDYYDPQAMPRSLGIGRSVRARFFQQKIETGSLFLFCAEPPNAWTENVIVEGTRYSLESLRRRLVHRAPDNIQALIVQFQSGSGVIHTLHRRVAPTASIDEDTKPDKKPLPDKHEERELPSIGVVETQTNVIESATTRTELIPLTSLKEALSVNLLGLRRNLAVRWQRWKDTLQRLRYAIATMFTRMLPGISEKPIELSAGTMLFIAIAIPLVVVAMALTVYFRSGREGEHKRYMEMALTTAAQAQSASDVNLQKEYWNEALVWLDKADIYGESDESIALRDYIKGTLDKIDGITRIEALPALKEELPLSLHVTQLAASGTDVYALDANEGTVWRLFLTSSGYEIDPDFQCGPDPAIAINPLIDLVSLPPINPLKATVMAMDGGGNVLYCAPGESPYTAQLTVPYLGWGEITAFTIRLNDLYVLDHGNNAVWKIGGTDYAFGEEPTLYFEHDIPQRLNEAIDLALSEDELFLLREGGTMISCLYQPLTKEVCTDPAPYGDLRPGREQQPLTFPEVKFIQLQATSPPEPSIYMLDMNQSTIYQFSLRLNLIRLLKPEFNQEYPVPQQGPSGFIITPNRILVIAFGNALYFASVP